jgi:hypothetical protein
MGQFAGYALPGAVFLVFGLKWSIEAAKEPDQRTGSGNYEIGQTEPQSLRSACPKFCCRLKGWPVGGAIKLTITALGIGGSLLAAYPNGRLENMGDILYATIYLFFAISGLVDILVFYCPQTMPIGVENFAIALSFIIEGLMFKLHLAHSPFMEQHVHTLLIYVIFATAFVSLVEVILPWTISKMIRGFLTLVHGSWYIQTGLILHSPFPSTSSWATSTDYNNALLGISLTFAWHCASIFVLLLILFSIIRRNRIRSLHSHNIPIPTFERERDASSQVCNYCSNSDVSKAFNTL